MRTTWTYRAEKFSAIEYSLVQCLISGAGGPCRAVISVRRKLCTPQAHTMLPWLTWSIGLSAEAVSCSTALAELLTCVLSAQLLVSFITKYLQPVVQVLKPHTELQCFRDFCAGWFLADKLLCRRFLQESRRLREATISLDEI